MKIIVLGGAGAMAQVIVRDLLDSPDVDTVGVADVNYDAVTGPNDKWKIGGGTVDTGVPPSIAAQWLAKGMIKTRGVVPPESCVDPLPYFRELSKRGIRAYEHSEETRPLF